MTEHRFTRIAVLGLVLAFPAGVSAFAQGLSVLQEAVKEVPTAQQITQVSIGNPTIGCPAADRLADYADKTVYALSVASPEKLSKLDKDSALTDSLASINDEGGLLMFALMNCRLYETTSASDPPAIRKLRLQLINMSLDGLVFALGTRFTVGDKSYNATAFPKDLQKEFPECAGVPALDARIGGDIRQDNTTPTELDSLFHPVSHSLVHCAASLRQAGYAAASSVLLTDIVWVDAGEVAEETQSNHVLILAMRSQRPTININMPPQPIVVQSGSTSCHGAVIGDFINWSCN